MNGVWTEERIERLRVDYLAYLSMSQIAKNLGADITRNAVIGKIHRLGLTRDPLPRSGRADAASPRPRSAVAPKKALRHIPAGPAARVPNPIYAREPDVPLSMPETDCVGTRAIDLLRGNECKWPVGDPSSPDFRFCGCKSDMGQPYCSHHARLAYQPSKPRGFRDMERFASDAPRFAAH